MKFDILEAINTVKEHFGTSGDITISTLDYGIAFTLSTIHKGQWLRKRFIISSGNLKLPNIGYAIDIQFKHAIHELQLAIAQIDTNPEENHNVI